MNFRNYWNLISISLFLIQTNNSLSQNEVFHGGSGDGFAIVKSPIINMAQVPFEGNALTVTINQDISQADPTMQDPILFKVIFSESVNDFDKTDIQFVGAVQPQNIIVTGTGTTYNIEVRGISSNGDVKLQIPPGKAHNSVGNPNNISTSTDNSVIFSGADLSVKIDLAIGQKLISNLKEVHFKFVFSESVVDFSNDDISLSGTANPSKIQIVGSGAIYDVAVTGMTKDGDIIINLPENRVHNSFGKGNKASENIGNKILVDYTPPNVEITQEIGQSDPAYTLPLNFHVEFSENVEEFNEQRVIFGGSEGVYLTVAGSERSYTVSLFGVKTNETLSISLGTNAAHDIAGNFNTLSTNTDNSITFKGITSISGVEPEINCLISYSEGFIQVKFDDFPNKNSNISIYDLQGKLHFIKDKLDQDNKFPFNHHSIFIIKVKYGKSIYCKMIIPVD